MLKVLCLYTASTFRPTNKNKYLIDSFSDNSTNIRPDVVLLLSCPVSEVLVVLLAVIKLCERNCSINFKDSERPVPSYLNVMKNMLCDVPRENQLI